MLRKMDNNHKLKLYRLSEITHILLNSGVKLQKLYSHPKIFMKIILHSLF